MLNRLPEPPRECYGVRPTSGAGVLGGEAGVLGGVGAVERIRGVMNITNSVWTWFLLREWNNFPIMGMSPKTGILPLRVCS